MTLLHKPHQKALSIGSVMIDIITVIADKDVELMTLHNMTSSFLMLEEGRKVESLSIGTYVGGGGANTAVCMSRLCMETSILALVDEDMNAEKIRERLIQEHIALDHLQVIKDVDTGVAVHIASHDRNAAIFTHRGANCNLEAAHVTSVDFTKYDLIYVTNLSNESAYHFPLIISHAANAGCFIASNPGIRQLTRLSDDFLKCLKSISLLSVNRVECATLVPKLVSIDHKPPVAKHTLSGDLPPLLAQGFQFGGFALGLVDCMKILSAHGPDYVVITDGSKGAYLLHGDSLYYCPAQKVVMRGSAGAGDCFSSTLSCLISAGNAPDISLYAASLNAISVISYVDTQEGLLTFEALSKSLEETYNITSDAPSIIRWDVG